MGTFVVPALPFLHEYHLCCGILCYTPTFTHVCRQRDSIGHLHVRRWFNRLSCRELALELWDGIDLYATLLVGLFHEQKVAPVG